PDLAAVVVDVGSAGKRVDDTVGVEGVDRVDVLGDDRGQLGDDLAWQGLAGHLAGSFLGVRWVFVAIFVWKKLSSTGRAIKSGDSLVQAPVDDTRGNRSRSERSRHAVTGLGNPLAPAS